jgi:hypothetical protein
MKINLSDYLLVAILGAALFAIILWMTGNCPIQINDKWQKEAIERGYASWVLSTNLNEFGEPKVEFKWK